MKKIPRCCTDTRLIEQVLLNLITNAIQAMNNGDNTKRLGISSEMDLNEMLKSVEGHYFQQASRMTNGHESNAAKLSNLKVSTFHYWIKQYRFKLFKL